MPRGLVVSAVVVLGCLIVLGDSARSVAAGRLTHGFVAYHTAARLLLEGEMGPQVYSQEWFRDEVQRRTESRVLEIFGPNPPTMALLALPVAGLDVTKARALWLWLSLIALVASVGVLGVEIHRSAARLLPMALAMLMLSPAAFANLRTAQAYLVVNALFVGAAWALGRRLDIVGGACLGLAVVTKTAGVPWLAVLALTRQWRAFGAALATTALVAIVALPWTGIQTWLAYPAVVREFVARPTTGLTAYQTTLGFMRHWCGPDGGGSGCTSAATAAAWLLLGAAVVVTGWAVRNAPPLLASAASVCLSLLCIPIAEDHQFVLLAVPILALTTTAARWSWIAVAVLFLVPAADTIERYTTGWLSWLAYPRLYVTWLLWILLINATYAARPQSGKAP